ncbi:MAG: N-acetylornithine carbamoyltransferase [Bacteroidetes bacterium]|nr:N-acetylornithine carbamoyltransferase [Bacteroidota bacterium]
MKSFIAAPEVSEINRLLALAKNIKKSPQDYRQAGIHKTLVLLFFNPSLRTRLSTEKAGLNLGMQVISMNADNGWKIEFEEGAIMNGDTAEHVKEAAAVVSQYASVIGIRSFPTLMNREKDYQEEVISAFVKYATVPVLSLESATRHPLQSFADLLTIEEFKQKDKPKVVLSWAPHPRALPQAVPNSFVEWMRRGNVNLVVTHPEGYHLSQEFIGDAYVTTNQKEAFEGADFIYAKNWSSFDQYGAILSKDPNWTITAEKMALTSQAKFMHCLPVRRNVVVADEVIDSPNAIHIAQASNRTWAAQAVLYDLLKD